METDYSFTQSAIDRMKESFLFAAAQGGSVSDIEALLDYGADINWRSPSGDTPLIIACKRGHLTAIQTLVNRGADVNACGRDDLMTPLHILAQNSDIEGLKMLMAGDMNINTIARNKNDMTALDIARSRGCEEPFAKVLNPRLSRRALEPFQANASINEDILSLPNINLSVRSSSSSNSSGFTQIQSLPNLSPSALSRLHIAKGQSRRLEVSTTTSSITSTSGNDSLAVERTVSPLVSGRQLIDKNSDRAKYTILGPDVAQQENDRGLKILFERELMERKHAEAKVHTLESKLSLAAQEHLELNRRIEQQHVELQNYKDEVNLLRGTSTALSLLSLEQCHALEKVLKDSLNEVAKRKDQLIAMELQNQSEHRLCVVCVERDKSVVLLPCRHMCLCEECSKYDTLTACPLCRKAIAHRISVFS